MTNILKKIAHPLNLQRIDRFIEEKTQSFSFPLDILALKMKELLALDDLEFKRVNATYKPKDEITKGLSKELFTLCYSDLVTSSSAFALISINAAQSLMKIFEKKEDDQALLQNEPLLKDYCKYLSTLFLQNIKSLDIVDELCLELSQKPLPKESAFCIDLLIKSQEQSLEIRLVFETEFMKQMQNKLKRRKSLLDSLDDLAEVSLSLSTVLDTTTLTKNELNELNVGDVILINTQFHPKENKGSFTLNLEQLPIAFARYKEGKIKILEAIKNSQEDSSNG